MDFISEYSKKKFIGTDAYTFTKERYDPNEYYYLTYKLDGTRKILVIPNTNKRPPVLVGRDLKETRVRVKFTKRCIDSIFDCEFFEGKIVIFDILVLNKVDLRDLNYSERLKILKSLRSSFKSENIVFKIPGKTTNGRTRTYNICDKFFILKDVFKNVTKSGTIDGIIFTPNTNYYAPPLKWKPIELLSIDFKIKKKGNLIFLLRTDGSVFQYPKLRGIGIVEVQKPEEFKSGQVWEFVMNERKRFVPIRLREDKRGSNSDKVIEDNMTTIFNFPDMKRILCYG